MYSTTDQILCSALYPSFYLRMCLVLFIYSEVGSLLPITVMCSMAMFYLVIVLVKFCKQQFHTDAEEIVEIPENHPCDVYK